MSLKFKLSWFASIIVISLCCGAPTVLVLFHIIGRSYAISIVSPPDYTPSELADHETGGGSGGTWVKNIYRTADEQNDVLSFMEDGFSGFILVERVDPIRTAPVYSNSACVSDTSLGRYFYSRGRYPCISVAIYPDVEIPSDTLIEIFEWYPDR